MQVAVVKDGVVHIHKISVSRDLGTAVETSTGVAADDQVIVNPPVDLTEGSKVEVRTS
jgi:hypothetical protein